MSICMALLRMTIMTRRRTSTETHTQKATKKGAVMLAPLAFWRNRLITFAAAALVKELGSALFLWPEQSRSPESVLALV